MEMVDRKMNKKAEYIKAFQLQKMGLCFSFAIFGIASIVLILETKYLIPFLSHITGQETVFWWFIVAGLGMFIPLLVTGGIILKKEGLPFNRRVWVERLRFKRVNGMDLLFAVGAIVFIGIISLMVMKVLELVGGPMNHQPPFMVFEPLSSGRYWLLLVWFPYWILNIMGEEILWRGIMLPRQEIVFGKWTWLIHGIGWLLFHIAFGWKLLITLLPVIFVLPYVVQKRKNSWLGVIIHAGINGPSFIAIAFGVL
jgi:membrane protease YdiL (CAAX protease family)